MLSSSAMRAVCADATFLQKMLDFEGALARAEAACGVIPERAVERIARACKVSSSNLPLLLRRRPAPAISQFPW